MSVFGTLVSKIFGHRDAPANTSGMSGAAAGVMPPAATPAATSAAAMPAAPAMAASNSARAEDVLRQLAAKSPEKLDWENSIVDLMKLVHMDNSLATRKELAQELGYTGDMNDSAPMNIWLHQKVMENLAQNGGQVAGNLLNG